MSASKVFTGEPLYPASTGVTTYVREGRRGCWVYCDESESLELFESREVASNAPDQDGNVAGRISVWEVSHLDEAEVLVILMDGQA